MNHPSQEFGLTTDLECKKILVKIIFIMSTNFEILVTIMKIILTKKVSYCSHYFSFGQHYFCNLTDRQAFFIMEASTDQKNFHVIMGKNAVNIGQHYFHNEDLSEAKIHIMKIMLTDIHGIIIIMS